MENRDLHLYVKTSLYVLVTLALFVVVYCLENIHAREYEPLPAILADAREPGEPLAYWEDAALASLYHRESGQYRLRVRPLFGAGQAGFDCQEGIHVAFIVNKENWYDGGDGWLYYNTLLGPGEAARPVCLQGYRDTAGAEANLYVRLVFDWLQG